MCKLKNNSTNLYSVARSLCDSRASCRNSEPKTTKKWAQAYWGRSYSSLTTKMHSINWSFLPFYRATQLCYRGLGDRNSARLSVCQSVTRVLCDKIKQCTADILNFL